MEQVELISAPNSPDGPLALIIATLLSSYIASERPEGDTLGWWAEIVQAVCFVSVGLLAAMVVIGLLIGLTAMVRR